MDEGWKIRFAQKGQRGVFRTDDESIPLCPLG